VLITLPELEPIKVLYVALVPVNVIPASVPITVLPCASVKSNEPLKVIAPLSSILNLSVPLVLKAICPLAGL